MDSRWEGVVCLVTSPLACYIASYHYRAVPFIQFYRLGLIFDRLPCSREVLRVEGTNHTREVLHSQFPIVQRYSLGLLLYPLLP